MELDLTARRNLELTETLRTKEKKGSLLWVLDKTRTAMGHRLIRAWMERPLLSPAAISRRLGAVEDLVNDAIGREELIHTLREITDLERLIGRIVYGTAGGRDLVSLCAGLGKLPQLRERLAPYPSAQLKSLSGELDDLEELRNLIGRAIVDEPPFSVREGGFIARATTPRSNRLRDIQTRGKDMVLSIEAREKEKTGIKSLKVGFNKVFGYYIEVSKSYYDQVPADYIRKQTLVNCERFITQELKDLEHEILTSQDRLTALEFQLFCDLREQAAAQVGRIQRSAAAVAQVDVLCSFARRGGRAALLPAGGGSVRPHRHHRGLAPGGGEDAHRRPLCAQRRPHGSGGRHGGHHHRPQHGGQEHLHAAGGPHRPHGPDGLLCACQSRPHRGGGPGVHPHRRQRRPVRRAVHLHGWR